MGARQQQRLRRAPGQWKLQIDGIERDVDAKSLQKSRHRSKNRIHEFFNKTQKPAHHESFLVHTLSSIFAACRTVPEKLSRSVHYAVVYGGKTHKKKHYSLLQHSVIKSCRFQSKSNNEIKIFSPRQATVRRPLSPVVVGRRYPLTTLEHLAGSIYYYRLSREMLQRPYARERPQTPWLKTAPYRKQPQHHPGKQSGRAVRPGRRLPDRF